MPDAPPGPAGGIVLRPFAAGDAEALAALWFDSWRSTSPTADLHVTRGDLRMRIDRDLAASDGGNGHLSAGIPESIIRRGEFFQPQTGSFVIVAHASVGSCHNKNFTVHK